MKLEKQHPMDKDWSVYYQATRNIPPRPLLIKALRYVEHKNWAIDIGAGALNDTRYLLNEGFKVIAIDESPLLPEQAADIPTDNLRVYVTSYEDFNFGHNQFDIASAMFALPFNPPQSFDRVFSNIRQSIVVGGVFCGQFFGKHDEWANNINMTFHTRDVIETILNGMEVIQINEKEEDGKSATGELKHWHLYHVIAKKQ